MAVSQRSGKKVQTDYSDTLLKEGEGPVAERITYEIQPDGKPSYRRAISEDAEDMEAAIIERLGGMKPVEVLGLIRASVNGAPPWLKAVLGSLSLEPVADMSAEGIYAELLYCDYGSAMGDVHASSGKYLLGWNGSVAEG